MSPPHAPLPSHGSSPSPRSGGTGSTPLIIAIAVAALLLVAVGVTALVLLLGSSDETSTDGGPDDETSTSDSPDDVVRDFIAAGDTGDCELLVEHDVTELKSVKECEELFDEATASADEEGVTGLNASTTIDSLEVTDETSDSATVVVEATFEYDYEGDTETFSNTREYSLEKTDDGWNIVDAEIVTED